MVTSTTGIVPWSIGQHTDNLDIASDELRQAAVGVTSMDVCPYLSYAEHRGQTGHSNPGPGMAGTRWPLAAPNYAYFNTGRPDLAPRPWRSR